MLRDGRCALTRVLASKCSQFERIGLVPGFSKSNPRVIRVEHPIIDPDVLEDPYDLLLDGPNRPDDVDRVMLRRMHFDSSEKHVPRCSNGRGRRRTIAEAVD